MATSTFTQDAKRNSISKGDLLIGKTQRQIMLVTEVRDTTFSCIVLHGGTYGEVTIGDVHLSCGLSNFDLFTGSVTLTQD